MARSKHAERRSARQLRLWIEFRETADKPGADGTMQDQHVGGLARLLVEWKLANAGQGSGRVLAECA